MKKILMLCLTLFVFGKVFAQDDVLLTQFYANKLYYNPASTGFSDKFFASATYRSQWAGGEGLPKSARPSYILFNASQYFWDYRSGVGLSIYNASQHVQNNFQIKASYAYHLEVMDDAFLAMGLNVGMMNKGIKNAETAADGLINESFTMSDLGFGIEYYMPELIVGLSVQHVPLVLGDKERREHSHFYYYMTYYHSIDQDWRVIPSVFLRNSSFITTVDLVARVSYQNMFQLGASWRRDALSVLVGFNFEDTFSVGYSFDIHNNKLRFGGDTQKVRPSHEIVLSYRTQLINTDNSGFGRLSFNASNDF